jgi:hypothetical protein
MSIPETVLIFVGSPLGIVALITAVVLGPSELKRSSRYRPGRGWPHQPAWYLPHSVASLGHTAGHPAIGSASAQPARVRDSSAVGGASGEW